MQNAHESELAKLSDSDLILADANQDIRDRVVVDRHGVDIGRVDDLFIDAKERKVRFLQIRDGGFLGLGERHFLLPVDTITFVSEKKVHVNESLDRIAQAPTYDPKLVDLPPPETWAPYYGYYGFSPFWASGYMYPTFPMSRDDSSPSERYVR